jgi:predicted nucleic acid-binding protein
MQTLKDFAKDFVPTQMKNVADLEMVKTEIEIHEEVRKNRDNEDYKVMFVVVEGDEYRVPQSVVEQLRTLLESKPDLKMFKVIKTGQGMGTKYQVIPL